MDLERARSNMIAQQIRTWGVVDDNILALFQHVKREDFTEEHLRDLALADTMLPLPHGQIRWTPMQEARVLQSLALQPDATVLEIGTGSGFFTALLSHCCQYVTSIDIYQDFTENAEQCLAKYERSNIRLVTADGVNGWIQDAPYDVIVITGSLPFVPKQFREQVNVGGRIFAVIGQPPLMQATLLTRVGEEVWHSNSLFETLIPPLVNVHERNEFTF